MAELAAKRPRTAGIGAAAVQPTIQVIFEANTHAEAPTRQAQDTPSSAAAASTSIASASDEAEPHLLCKRGDSLAALQRAGMLEPSPTDQQQHRLVHRERATGRLHYFQGKPPWHL